MSRATWPKQHRGTVTLEAGRCALCGRVDTWDTPIRASHLARKYARIKGWTFIQPFGWVCHCRSAYPGMRELETQLTRSTGRRAGVTKIQISLSIE